MLQRLVHGIVIAGLVASAYLIGGAVAERMSTHDDEAGGSSSQVGRVRNALEDPDALSRLSALSQVLRSIGAAEIGEVVRAYEERIEVVPVAKSDLELLGDRWAEIDPSGAVDRVSRWRNAEMRALMIDAVVRRWAHRSPMEAFHWAETRIGEDRTAAMDSVFHGWAETDDPEVWKILRKLDLGMPRESATNIVMKAFVEKEGFDALFERVAAIEPDVRPGSPRDWKLSALRTAIGLCAYYDPERALAEARRYTGGPYDNGLLRRVAIYWAVKDGQAALETFAALPNSVERDRALRDGYRKWLLTDRDAALSWMPEEAKIDPRFDPLLDLYVVSLARRPKGDREENIQASVRWVEGVEDPARRDAVAALVGAVWQQHDPEAANPWIEQRGLAERVAAERRQRVTRSPTSRAARPESTASPPD